MGGKKKEYSQKAAILEVTRITFKNKMILRVRIPFEEGEKKNNTKQNSQGCDPE